MRETSNSACAVWQELVAAVENLQLSRNKIQAPMHCKVISSLAVVVALTGCAPATLQGLRDKPAGQTQFETKQNYQTVYRTVLNNARKCFQMGMLTAQMVVNGDVFSESKEGEVTVALSGGLGVDVYVGVDIKAIDDERTNVRIYTAKRDESTPRVIKAWLETGTASCRL